MKPSVDFENCQTNSAQSQKPLFKFIKVPEEEFNTISHLIGALFSYLGLIFLILRSIPDFNYMFISFIYGFSNFLLFLVSGICHSQKKFEDDFSVWCIFDQIAIYLMIAGTYTPISYIYLAGRNRILILLGQWMFACLGIILKIKKPKTPKWITAGIYLIQGWMLLFVIQSMLIVLIPFHLIMIFSGGMFYTIGAIFYVSNKPEIFPGSAHNLWHIFVILGAICFYIVIYQSV